MEMVQQALAALEARPEVAGAALVSREGLVVASRLPAQADSEAMAALMVTLARTAEQLAEASGRTTIDRMVLEGAGGMIIAMPVAAESLLVVLTAPGAAAGKLLYDLRQSRGDLAALLSSPPPA